MILFEKITMIIVLGLSIAVTVTGFFWEGWPVFLGMTMIVSTLVPMLGAWTRSSNIKNLAKQESKIAA